MKKQINIRVSDLTEQQLDALAARWGTSITETITVLVDRAYREETTMDWAIDDLRQKGMDKCERCGATWSAVDLSREGAAPLTEEIPPIYWFLAPQIMRQLVDADRSGTVVAHCCCAACGEQRWYRVTGQHRSTPHAMEEAE